MANEGEARVEVVGDVSNFARQTERDLDKALSKVKLDPVEVPVDVDGARAEGFRAGRQAGSGFNLGFSSEAKDGPDTSRLGGKLVSGFLSMGVLAAKTFAGALGPGLAALPVLLAPVLIAAGAGIAGAIGVGAAAVIGSALGAAITAGVGVGVIGLGALVLKEEPALKSAAKSLTETVKSEFAAAAQPMLGPLVQALGVFEDLVVRLRPQLNQLFAGAVPLIPPLVDGIASLAENALPGLIGLVSSGTPVMVGLAAGLAQIGNDVSAMFTSIADAGPELGVFFEDLLGGIGNVIVGIGNFIAWSARMYAAIKQFFTVNDSPGAVFDAILTSIQNLVTNGFNYLISNLPAIISGFLAMRAAVTDAILGLITSVGQALPTLIPQIVSALAGLVPALVNQIVSMVPALVTAAITLVNGLVQGLLAAIPILIPAAVQLVTGLISGLIAALPSIVAAGISLINGLIQGIVTAVPLLIQAVISAIPVLVNAVITAVPQLIAAGISLLMALINGLITAIPQLLAAVPVIITGLLNAIVTNLPMLIEAGVQAIVQLLNGLIGALDLIINFVTSTLIPTLVSTIIAVAPMLAKAALTLIVTLVGALIKNIPTLLAAVLRLGLTIVTGLLSIAGKLVSAAVTLMTAFGARLLSFGVARARAATQAVRNAIVSFFSSATSWLTSAGTKIITGLVNGIKNRVAFAVGALKALRTAAVNAFSGARSWLASAGRQIIDGLISGIRSGFDRVRGLLNSLTGMLPDWKGPAKVDAKILEPSGDLVMAGFEAGLQKRIGSIRKTLAGVTADLPAMTMTGGARGGDGAALAAAPGMMVTIAPGAIIVNGADRQSGIDAAEALLERLAQAAVLR